MTHRRTKLSIAIVFVVLLLLAGAIYLRKEAPPEAARLLPESDGIVYYQLTAAALGDTFRPAPGAAFTGVPEIHRRDRDPGGEGSG